MVQAVITSLVQNHGLGARALPGAYTSNEKKQLLLFGGGSAGSRGAMVHLDYVTEMLAKAGAPSPDESVAVVGFMDSPLWIDI